MDLDALVSRLRADTRRGAAELAREAIAAAEAILDTLPADRSPAPEMRALARGLVSAQPAMAPLVRLAAALVESTRDAPAVDAHAAARAALADYRDHLSRAPREVAARAEVLIPTGGSVLTGSSSSTVREALLGAARRRTFSVVCLEGRPNLEGRDLAASLAAAGVAVTLAVDAAVTALIRNCDVVLMGADSIGDLGVVNKVGTRSAALAARSAAIPAYVLADTTKLLPAGYPQPVEEDRPAQEVWAEAPAGVRVWNRYFEATPLGYFHGVVTEQGMREPEELERIRGRLRLPPGLRDGG